MRQGQRVAWLAGLVWLAAACNASPGTIATVAPTAEPTVAPTAVVTEPTTAATQPATTPPAAATSPPVTGGATTTPAPAVTGPIDFGQVRVALEHVADLEAPTAIAIRPGEETLYVAERAGRVVPLRGGVVGAPVLDITARTVTAGEQGLLGLAWSPDGGTLYVSSSDTDGASRVEAYVVEDDGRLRQPDLVLRVDQPPARNHKGGNIVFGPDGHLWFGLGDGGGANDVFGNGQDPTQLLSTMVRIAPAGATAASRPAARRTQIPPDNPYARGGSGRPEVWAYGLRNPWRFSFDRGTGDLWIGDVGQYEVEEIDLVVAGRPGGANFGWPVFEGDDPFNGDPQPPDYVAPVHTYGHERGGCAVTGGFVYRGTAIPALQGAYLYADYCDGRVFALDLDRATGEVRTDYPLGPSLSDLVSFAEDAAGELYLLSLTGQISRLVPAG